jgi:hypothetical protein
MLYQPSTLKACSGGIPDFAATAKFKLPNYANHEKD